MTTTTPSAPVRILGRDPAVILAFVAGLISVVSTLVFELTTLQQASLNGAAFFATGLITAWIVKGDALLPALLGFVEAGLAVAVAFGVDIPKETQTVVVGFIGVSFAMFVRTQVTAPVDQNGLLRVRSIRADRLDDSARI